MDAAAFNEVFELHAHKGEILVKAGASIDYERGKRSYWLTVTVTDAEDASEATIPMSITVINLDDPGTIRLSTTEPRVGRQVTFELTDPDGNPRIFSYKTLRDHAFTVTGGTVAGARRLDSGSDTPNIRWEISAARTPTAT